MGAAMTHESIPLQHVRINQPSGLEADSPKNTREIQPEEVGFEPTIQFPVCRFSKPVPSAARPPLHGICRRSNPPGGGLGYAACLAGRRNLRPLYHGGGGIRTHGTVSRTPVFKTGAFNRSATPPAREQTIYSRLGRIFKDIVKV